MKSEALRNIRTMQQVKTSLDVARSQRPRTVNSLSKTSGEKVLEKEKMRFAAQEASINKSRQRLLRTREKLAMTINKNRALTELRHELQQARREGKDPVAPKAEMPASEQNLRQMELRY